jgi:general secretion pathway protein D
LIGVLVWTASQPAISQSQSERDSTPITQLIASVAQKTGKKFIVDPRVRADVTVIGQNTSSISYPELLTILQVHGFVASEGGGYVRVTPDAAARVLATSTALGNQAHPDAELVNKIIPVKTMPAATLVPILRPLLPQHAHLAAVVCRNALLMVDTYANVKRIEALVEALDTGKAYAMPEKCEMPSAPPRPAPVPTPAPESH